MSGFWAQELVLFGRWYVADEDLPALTRPALDEWLAHCVDLAPGGPGHFGCDDPEVLAHAEAERTFWAPEVFFASPDGREGWYRNLPESPRTRAQLDARTAHLLDRLRPLGSTELRGGPRAAIADLPVNPERQRFWAPEVLLFGDWYLIPWVPGMLSGNTRSGLDVGLSIASDMAMGRGGLWANFWSPELPEVEIVPQVHVPESVIYAKHGGWMHPVGVVATLLLLLCLSLPAGAQTLFGVVSKVSDGDTLTVGKTRVRLFGIDAPEGRQECQDGRGQAYRCGDLAEAALLALAPVGSSISCRVRDIDRYGRLVAVCSVAQRAGSDLSREMVRAGWAVAYRKYSTAYVPDELLARQAGLGLWAGSFVSPEEWRHAR